MGESEHTIDMGHDNCQTKTHAFSFEEYSDYLNPKIINVDTRSLRHDDPSD